MNLDPDAEAAREPTGQPVAPGSRPRWLRLLSFVMLMMAAHLGFEGLAALRANPQPPAGTAVVLSAAEARLRAFQTATALMGQKHPRLLRLHAGGQLVMAAVFLFTVAALFTRDPRGRRLAIAAAIGFSAYQIGHAAFALWIERPVLLTTMPALADELHRIGEIAPENVEVVRESMTLATVIGPMVFLFLGLSFSSVMLVFFAGRRGRILYGLQAAPQQPS